jgi:succinate dehydrogenase / fumarate reductase flavoprotein subunit
VHRIREALTRVMTDKVGVFRTGTELKEAFDMIDRLRAEYGCLRVPPPAHAFEYRVMQYWELGYLLETAAMITEGALRRTESRGGHFRADFPARDDMSWLKHTFVTRTERGPVFSDGRVRLGQVLPAARSY